MARILVIQFVCAVVPGIVGLVWAARALPRTIAVMRKCVKFDLLSMLLVTSFVGCILALNRLLVDEDVIAQSKASIVDVLLSVFVFRGDDAAYRLLAVYVLSFVVLPVIILPRLILDNVGESQTSLLRRRHQFRSLSLTDGPAKEIQVTNQRKILWRHANNQQPQHRIGCLWNCC